MTPLLTALVHVLYVAVFMLSTGAILIWMLRKVLGHAHLRLGPTELGPWGLAQLIPDILKLVVKEDRHPTNSDRWIYIIAPFLVFVPSMTAYAAIPFSESIIAADINLGAMMTLAFLTVVPLGIFAAGWGGRNKYGLLGAARALGGAISYEIPLILAVISPVMLAGSANLVDIVNAQSSSAWYGIIAFPAMVVFFIAGLMETNQPPFDMSEAESELVAGFSTEYSAMRFGLMYVAEFSNTFLMSAMLTVLFLGGWTLPFVPNEVIAPVAPIILLIKSYLVVFLMMMIRGILSRLRVDRYMHFGWKTLLPFTIVWTVLLAFGVKAFQMWGGGL